MKEGEIERIVTLLSETNDPDECRNIAQDILKVIIIGFIMKE